MSEILAKLRADGWMVAVHNDYRLEGELFTFWLLTKGDRFIKGEGRTDEEALAQASAYVGCTFCGKPLSDELHSATPELLNCSSFTADDYHTFTPPEPTP